MNIRKGRSDDARFLASAILAASRGHLCRGWFDLALGRSESECLVFLAHLTVTSTPSLWHHSRFWVAEESDTGPVAVLAAFRAADAYPISPVAIAETADALGFSAKEQAEIWERGQYAFACTVPPDDNSLVIENVATSMCHRRAGYMSALLAHALESGRREGLPEAQVTLLIGNESAERVYRKAGFRLVNEWRHEQFAAAAGSPGLRRFVRVL